jgi:tetratricopeptide (TPR) repeat protein
MIRSTLAAICMALLASNAQAAGPADLKAATAAVEKGMFDEAIQLFSEALAAGNLSPDDEFVAHKERGREYSAKAQIADAFERYADGRRLRDNAIVDLTAAIKLKADDKNVLIDRGQNYYLNGTFDLATADFTAALKLDNLPSTLVQRAASRRDAGDYEGAIADCTTALSINIQEAGLDAWEVYNERGYAEFLAGRYDAAAADFNEAIVLGSPLRVDDVLWLPYQSAWLHIARARSGQNDADELARNATKVDLKTWPGMLLAFFLGQAKLEDMSVPSPHGAMGHSRECNSSMFAGENALARGDQEQASRLMSRAREVCNIHTLQHLVADVELTRMKK